MDEVESGDEQSSPGQTRTRGDGVKRTRYYRNHAANTVLRVKMPTHPPELRGHPQFLAKEAPRWR